MMREEWIEVEYGDILDYEQPTKYIVNTTDYKDEYNIPVLTAGKTFIKGFTNETDNIFDKVPVIIFDDFTTASQFVDFKFKVKSSAMKILSPKIKGIDIKYIFYGMQLNHIKAETHKRYWISVYSKMMMRIPPRPIQRAIVNKIEGLFLLLEEGIADLKKAQNQLKIYRESVLKNAFEGKYTHQNKRTLFEWRKIGDISTIKGGKRLPSKHHYATEKTEFKYLMAANLKNMTVQNSSAFIFKDTYEALSNYKVTGGEVYITIVGACIGDVGIIPMNIGNAILTENAAKIINLDKIYNKYLAYWIRSSMCQKEIKQNILSATLGKLALSRIANLSIKITDLDTQQLIVKEIESRFSVCDELEQTISEALLKANAIRQSILKKAFSGELLTENEISTCKKEADYESSKELLKQLNKKNKK